jgi:hypothetical protein
MWTELLKNKKCALLDADKYYYTRLYTIRQELALTFAQPRILAAKNVHQP